MITQNTANDKAIFFQNLNEKIRFPNLLLINEKGQNVGVVTREEALQAARDNQLDLLCITPNAKPPVCKILDFSKYLYQIRKKNEDRNGNKANLTKEAKFSFAISENDAIVKIKKIIKWLEKGIMVKIVLFMRGREQQHKDLALQKIDKILTHITNTSSLFQLKDEIKLVGNSYLLTLFKNKKIQKNEKN